MRDIDDQLHAGLLAAAAPAGGFILGSLEAVISSPMVVEECRLNVGCRSSMLSWLPLRLDRSHQDTESLVIGGATAEAS